MKKEKRRRVSVVSVSDFAVGGREVSLAGGRVVGGFEVVVLG